MNIKNLINNNKGLSKEEAAKEVVQIVIKKMMDGKQLMNFDVDDWKEIAEATGYEVNTEEIAAFVSNLLISTPEQVKEQLGIIRVLVVEQVEKFRAGKISELEFIETCELICLEGTVRAISNTIGNFDIKLPMLGTILEDTNCEMLYRMARQYMNDYEQQLITSYIEHFRELETELDKQYQVCLEATHKDIEEFFDLLDVAFDEDSEVAFQGSITLAEHLAVKDKDVLRSKEEIDNYFE